MTLKFHRISQFSIESRNRQFHCSIKSDKLGNVFCNEKADLVPHFSEITEFSKILKFRFVID